MQVISHRDSTSDKEALQARIIQRCHNKLQKIIAVMFCLLMDQSFIFTLLSLWGLSVLAIERALFCKMPFRQISPFQMHLSMPLIDTFEFRPECITNLNIERTTV